MRILPWNNLICDFHMKIIQGLQRAGRDMMTAMYFSSQSQRRIKELQHTCIKPGRTCSRTEKGADQDKDMQCTIDESPIIWPIDRDQVKSWQGISDTSLHV